MAAIPGSELDGEQLATKAHQYVQNRLETAGGFFREGFHGIRLRTLPMMLDRENFSFGVVAAFVLRLALLFMAPLAGILGRKLITLQPGTHPRALSDVWTLVANLDSVDIAIGVVALLATALPPWLRRIGRKEKAGLATPHHDFAAAIDKIPNPASSGDTTKSSTVEDALRLTLSAIRGELAQLIGAESQTSFTGVALLEFCDPDGSYMKVRARTTSHEPTGRPVEAWRFQAYYVAKSGRWFAEHNFLSHRNPFPKRRLTLNRPCELDYDSVLYLPIITSEEANVSVGPVQPPVDFCIGVVCVHSSKPYRFWRWGDHRKKMAGFGDVAFARASPYIALVRKLLEPTAHKIRVN